MMCHECDEPTEDYPCVECGYCPKGWHAIREMEDGKNNTTFLYVIEKWGADAGDGLAEMLFKTYDWDVMCECAMGLEKLGKDAAYCAPRVAAHLHPSSSQNSSPACVATLMSLERAFKKMTGMPFNQYENLDDSVKDGLMRSLLGYKECWSCGTAYEFGKTTQCSSCGVSLDF